LLKEKEALEASLKALTASNASDKSCEPGSKPSGNETKNEETNINSASISEMEVIPLVATKDAG
jgi:DNA uptake protein ComE-like DNA-binding protein